MGCIWQEQHSWDYTTWRGIKAFTVNTTEQPGMLWLENSRCSLSLPLSRALLLFQLGFGGSWTYFLLLPDDSWPMPSLFSQHSSPQLLSLPSLRWPRRLGLQQEGCPLHGVSGTWGETPLTPPDPEGPAPNQPSCSPVLLGQSREHGITECSGLEGPTTIIRSNTWGSFLPLDILNRLSG